MQIFIDESGNFQPGTGSRISCGAALVVPEGRVDGLLKYFGRLIAKWDEASGRETKGSELDEVQMEAVIGLAAAYDPLLVICAIDAGDHEETAIREIIARQGEKITASLTEQHHPNLARQMHEIRAEWEKLSPQLAIQAYILFALVESVLRDATLYFAQREPSSLGQWSWIIDAKDKQITSYERVWQKMVMPALQAAFFETGLESLEGADYSHWERMRFEPGELERVFDEIPDGGDVFSVGKVMEDVSFETSAHPGLRVIDMLTGAFRRAVAGNLQRHGWQNLGRLIVQGRRHPVPQPLVRVVMLTAEAGEGPPIEHAGLLAVIDVLTSRCKPMIVP